MYGSSYIIENDKFWDGLLAKNNFEFKTLFSYMSNIENSYNSKFNFLLASYLFLNFGKNCSEKVEKWSSFNNLLKKFDIYSYKTLGFKKVNSEFNLNEYLLCNISKCNDAKLLGEFFYQMVKNGATSDHFINTFKGVVYYLVSNCNVTVFADGVFNMCKMIVNNDSYCNIPARFTAISDFMRRCKYCESEYIVYSLLNNIRLAIDKNVNSLNNGNEINKAVEKLIDIYKYIYIGDSEIPKIEKLGVDAESGDTVMNSIICSFMKNIGDNTYSFKHDSDRKYKIISDIFNYLTIFIKANKNMNVDNTRLMVIEFLFSLRELKCYKSKSNDVNSFTISFCNELLEFFMFNGLKSIGYSENLEKICSKCRALLRLNINIDEFISGLKVIYPGYLDLLESDINLYEFKKIFSKYTNLLKYRERIFLLEDKCDLYLYRYDEKPLYVNTIDKLLKNEKSADFTNYICKIKERINVNELFGYHNGDRISSCLSYDSGKFEVTESLYNCMGRCYKDFSFKIDEFFIDEKYYPRLETSLVFASRKGPVTDFFLLVAELAGIFDKRGTSSDTITYTYKNDYSENAKTLENFLMEYLNRLFEEKINEDERKKLVLPLLAVLYEIKHCRNEIKYYVRESILDFLKYKLNIESYADRIINVFEKEFEAGKFKRIESLQKLYTDYIDRRQSTDDKKTLDKYKTKVTKESDNLTSKKEVKELIQNEEIQKIMADKKIEKLMSAGEVMTDDKLVKIESKDIEKECVTVPQKIETTSLRRSIMLEYKFETAKTYLVEIVNASELLSSCTDLNVGSSDNENNKQKPICTNVNVREMVKTYENKNISKDSETCDNHQVSERATIVKKIKEGFTIGKSR